MTESRLVFPKPVEFTVKRVRGRRTIGISVDQEARVILRVSPGVSQKEIELAIYDQREWIENRQQRFRALKEQFPKKKFVHGEPFPFLGKNLSLKFTLAPGLKPRVVVENQELHIHAEETFPPEQARDWVISWYKVRALETMRSRVPAHAERLKVTPISIRIRDQRRCWASCSEKGALSFNWRLVMMPEGIIDYIIVHELCHIFHLDHSPQFWEKVKEGMPDFEDRRQWLKERTFEYTYPL